MTVVKDSWGGPGDGRGMTTIADAAPGARTRNRWLKDAVGRRDGAAGLLLLDTLAAIGFAAGIAGGVTAVTEQGAVLPWALLMLGMGGLRALFASLASRRGAVEARRTRVPRACTGIVRACERDHL